MCASRTCISRLGDFDDHLEDVTIGEHGFSRGRFDLVTMASHVDWLRNRSCLP